MFSLDKTCGLKHQDVVDFVECIDPEREISLLDLASKSIGIASEVSCRRHRPRELTRFASSPAAETVAC
ncbi:hypothetical protein ACSFA7_21875 [Variovorax sp. LT1R20]|uniref:hypothetical protein n=1 Tax=Variovorax sp. LT1R20 TaxID=3443729 RepID=UPI003F463D46